MNPIKHDFIIPSSALVLRPGQVRYFQPLERRPRIGDVVYGQITRIGETVSLENVSGRIHKIFPGTRSVFVFGNRYAPDAFEALIPQETPEEIDLVSRSGMIANVNEQNVMVKAPTRVRILGYVLDPDGQVLNTLDYPRFTPRQEVKKQPRSRLILVCGTAMNSGKSWAAAACCRALTTRGHRVRSSKVTGTASLKDILLMNDAGATPFNDFSYLGYPSTYGLAEGQVLDIFNQLDRKYANNPRNYWIVELADGLLQRETGMLLASPDVQSRIHKLVFCARDALGIIGGLQVLREEFDLKPDAISGLCSGSPLSLREVEPYAGIPVFNSADPDLISLENLLAAPHILAWN